MPRITQLPPGLDFENDDVFPYVNGTITKKLKFFDLMRLLKAIIFDYFSPDDVRTLDYGSFQNTKRYPTDAIEESAALYNAGFVRPMEQRIASPYTVSTEFRFFSSEVSPGARVPFKRLAVNQYIVPLQGVWALTANAASIPIPFSPAMSYERGITHLRYENYVTTHALLSGSLRFHIRVSHQGTENVQAPAMWLMLRATPKPDFENQDATLLAMVPQFKLGKLFKMGTDQVGITVPAPDYATVLAEVATTAPLNVTVRNGRIEADHTDEELTLTDNPREKTTDWFPVNAGTRYILKTDGTSNASRIQWKDETGRIYYDSQSANPLTSNRIINAHPKAIAMRVWFATVGDTSGNVSIWEVPEKFDPSYGYWATYDFNISKAVAFEPNTLYHFELRQVGGSHVNLRPDGFILESGSLQMLDNARDTLQVMHDEDLNLYQGELTPDIEVS